MTRLLRFRTMLTRTGQNTTGIPVPPEIIEQLDAGKRPALVARVNGYSYRTTVGVMGGTSMLSFSAGHRKASGLEAGADVSVEVQVDQTPRTVAIPSDLDVALTNVPGLRDVFLKQAPSRQKADVENVGAAKGKATRSRRIAAIVARLRV